MNSSVQNLEDAAKTLHSLSNLKQRLVDLQLLCVKQDENISDGEILDMIYDHLELILIYILISYFIHF